jgi:hypothetical protein
MTFMKYSSLLITNKLYHIEWSENAHYRCVPIQVPLSPYVHFALVRFSTVGGEAGSADSARDPRGFAIK